MKKIVFALTLLFSATSFSQTIEELKAEKAKKDAELAKLQGEVKALQTKIASFPGWKFGAFGTIGVNLSGFNNWYSNAVPNSSAGNIGVTINGFANLDKEKYFWKNSSNINLGWIKLDDKNKKNDETGFKGSTDVFSFTSLFGYKITKSFAVSTLAEYKTTFIENFNDPGYLDVGLGATWTPISELVVVIHPLNYNFVFSKGATAYDSSTGAKIVAEYNKTIGSFKFKSNVSTFQSYKTANLSNWTWINYLGFSIWKGIGVALEGGIRQNKQESFNSPLNKGKWVNLSEAKSDLQSYWLFGLSYRF